MMVWLNTLDLHSFWKMEMSAQVLKSVAELQAAIDNGTVTTKATTIVVNMPFLTWPGGRR